MELWIITFIIGVQVGVFIGILWEQRQRRLFREMVNKIKELG
jgi:ABC-type antimicrobial peptide transport system permease subunit